MLDILIAGGWVVDGSGGPRYRADVAVENGRIVDVGHFEEAQARTRVDATQHIVSPGFVDMHSHADLSLPINPAADSLVRQGITTVVIGQCGLSPAPLLKGTREQVIAVLESEDMPLPWDEWSTFEDYLGYLAQLGISTNVVPLVGHGVVRGGVMGMVAGRPSDEQRVHMVREILTAMDNGAIGVSSGLIYPPGSYATTGELIDLTRPVGQRNGFYFSHIRNESDELLEAIDEAIQIGRATGAAVQISHLKASGRENWDKAAQALERIDRAREEGLDVTADVYPYLAGSTYLAAVLPHWAHEGGKKALLQRLADPDARRRMEADVQATGDFRIREWDSVLISGCPRKRELEGRSIADMAAEAGTSAYTWIFDLLLEVEADASMVIFGMSEDNIELELRHPAVMIGTDGFGMATEGPLSTGVPHPRNYGTYPRVLAHYVRKRGVISLEEAIWKMSGLPAQKLRWTDRGQVKKGYRADLTIFHPDTVADLATYDAPHQYPAGIPHVIVNGTLVIQGHSHTQARPGRILS